MISDSVAPIHLAVQYLAAAGISFLDKKEDDSHTNLGYSKDLGQIYTRPLNDKGDRMLLDLNDFSLKWSSDNLQEEIKLNGRTHKEVLKWIGNITEKVGLKNAFKYQFHYELPYEIKDDYIFSVSSEIMARERHLRSITHNILGGILDAHGLKSEIRIWPHHFDSGAFAQLPGSNGVSIGLGLAIPDSISDGYYFYLSGYHGHDTVNTQSFGPLTNGYWSEKDFNGAILDAEGIAQDVAIKFFDEAISAYRI